MKSIYILTILFLASGKQSWGQEIFTESQLKTDLLFYKAKLEQYHPNLYLYTTEQRFNAFFDSLYQSINHSIPEAEFYQKITLSSEIVKDGHTLILPSNTFIEYHNAQSKFLPLQIGLIDQKLYVKMNCTRTSQLPEGVIIDSINGIPSGAVIKELLNRQVRDGENPSYAKWILDTYFREYYSYLFGHPNLYQISYTKDNHSYTIQIPALLKDSIYYYRQKNYPLFYAESIANKGIYLSHKDSKQVAILTVKDFHTDILKSEYKQNFAKEIKNVFDEIILKEVPDLIIDLRDNQGGDVENGVLLLRNLINKPVAVVNQYQRVKNGNLTKCKGPSMGKHKPFNKQFKGQIYVLLNGGSFSNSVILSSCLRQNTNAIFVGTETGGNPNVLAGYARGFELPNTKIRVEVPTKRFVMTSLTLNNGAGLIPTYSIENGIQENVSQKDNQLEFLLNLIKQNENKDK